MVTSNRGVIEELRAPTRAFCELSAACDGRARRSTDGGRE